MARNLGVGNIGEAYFRLWWDENVAPHAPGLRIAHLGYNPEGIVVGREKVEMLKALQESPDFAIVPTNGRAKPLLGVSINTQNGLYTMHNARSPPLCWTCARKDQQACFDKSIGNLWYNKYNITNDYRLFREAVGVDVALVTFDAAWFKGVFEKVQQGGLEPVALRYLHEGNDGSSEMRAMLDILGSVKRGSKLSPRKRVVRWLSYSRVADAKVPHAIVGGFSNVGRPPEKVCVDAAHADDEASLVRFLTQLR